MPRCLARAQGAASILMLRRWAVVVALVLGCGASGAETAVQDAAAAQSLDGTAPDVAGPALGGGSGTAMDAASVGGSGGLAASGGAGGNGGAHALVDAGMGLGGGGGSTVTPLPTCARPVGFSYTPCGYLAPDYTWAGRWKDGYPGGTCTVSGAQRVGCLVPLSADTRIEGASSALCLGLCREGCYRRAGSPCMADSDCCSPLRCQAGTCR